MRSCQLVLSVLSLGLALALAAHGALASGGGKSAHGKAPAGGSAHAAKPVQPLDPRVVNIAVLVAPVVEGGRLSGYLYMSVNLRAVSEPAAAKIKRDLPLIQDALLRALYARPLEREAAKAQDIGKALAARLKAASAGLVEAAALEALEIASLVRVPL